MKHNRDWSPEAALPNFVGVFVTYRNDGMRVAIDGLVFEMDVSVECRGCSEGQFEPRDVTVTDVFGNRQEFSYHSSKGSGLGLRAGVMAAIDREWSTIAEWCVEQAEMEAA